MIHRLPGAGQVTIDDVARTAGVSKTTAAAVLRDAAGFRISPPTRWRVQDAAKTLGYRRNGLAAALSSGRTHTVGILLPLHHLRATSPMYRTYGQDVFVAVFEAACHVGLRVTSIPPGGPGEDHLPALQELTDRRVDGVILASVREREFVETVYASGMACVELGSGFGRHLIHPDNEGGAASAVAHLFDLGHRHIAHWRGPLGGYFASDARAEGFRRACTERGLAFGQTPIVESEYDLMALLAQAADARPTAVFAFNDNQALLTLDIVRRADLRVPEDVSVVGFDDNVIAETARPTLTTVHNPLFEQAVAALQVLQTIWAGDARPVLPPPLPTHLVIRHSTAVSKEKSNVPVSSAT